MRQERITSPFGYGRLEVLKRKDYVRLNPNGEVPVFVSGAEVLPVTFSELMLASSSFPVVFIQPAGAQQYMPVVMTGLEKGINLFTTIEAGAKKSTQKVLWDTNAYLPAYVRRHPFCMSTVNGEAGADDELLVCVQADYVSKTPSEGYVALFDSKE